MKTIFDAHLAAARAFSVQTALRMVPPPFNQTRDDLRNHIRTVLFQGRAA